MDTTTTANRLPTGFRAYGEVVMTAPARPGDLAHRPAYRWIAHPVPVGTAAAAAPADTAALMNSHRTGSILVRPACEPAPDPAETTATTGWHETDMWQMSAGWADYQHAARPCTAAQCFPNEG
ncbi:hypothetical protein [Phytohabitans aurantiacus]|uniref:Uncharacterized protein n=1 Tax=Phytohabitans aurantiacus TaxID=3016789 RepID=A0ABQ5QU06_9ACTN|nr:hypothetical protein [Phytohabitans aurantiacus]GLH97131.1 hypothetical protein Pa4123_24060 [Phytohabitans aurantiacus]